MLLDAMPDPCERALDVGCGEGIVARELRRSVPHVAAIDIHAPSLELARAQDPRGEIDYRLGDFMQAPFEPASFDFVTCAAALHHMDLRALAEATLPGARFRRHLLFRYTITWRDVT